MVDRCETSLRPVGPASGEAAHPGRRAGRVARGHPGDRVMTLHTAPEACTFTAAGDSAHAIACSRREPKLQWMGPHTNVAMRQLGNGRHAIRCPSRLQERSPGDD
jgi:hypothetical protein